MKSSIIYSLLLLLINYNECKIINRSDSMIDRENSFTPIKKSYKTILNKYAYDHKLDKAVVLSSHKSRDRKSDDILNDCLIGIFLFVMSFPALWLNERRAVETDEFIENGKNQCLSADSSIVDSANENKLVHMTGKTVVLQNLIDTSTEFLPQQTLIKLQRNAEMYAYIEHVETKKNTTTYSYTQGWCRNVKQNLHDKNYQNPSESQFLVKDETWTQNQVFYGAFMLSDSQIAQLNNFKTLEISDNQQFRQQIEELINQKYYFGNKPKLFITRDYLYIKQYGMGSDVIGDQRISYKGVETGNISTISQQVGNSFKPYFIGVTGNHRCCCEENQVRASYDREQQRRGFCSSVEFCRIPKLACDRMEVACRTPDKMDLVYQGILTSDKIFYEEHKSNLMLTILYRFLGWLCMYVGIYIFFSPFLSILKAVPLLSSLGKIVVFIFAALISIPVTFIVIASSWILHRPFYSFLLLAISAGAIFFLHNNVFDYNNIL